MSKELSIVIIGRNEEATITKCLDAAVLAAQDIGGAEIVYVDSYSDDHTVQEVKRFGVEVQMLDRSLRRCPSSARYFGTIKVSGKFVLFLDADTLIYRGFLSAALAELQHNPTLAGVNGWIDDTTESGEPVDHIEERHQDPSHVKWLRGPSCLYRRRALIEVGGFDPHLATEEEAELGLRLIRAGWELKVIPLPMAHHTRCFHPTTMQSLMATFMRDLRYGRLGEITRTVRKAFAAGNAIEFCWLRLKTTLLFVIWCIAVIASALFVPAPLGTAFAAAVAGLGAVALVLKKRSLSQAFLFIPAKLANLIDLLVGIVKIASPDNISNEERVR